jgi:ABC-type antimicrobial peptide transport system permease subunit
MALGAAAPDVRRMVLRQGLTLAGIGTGVGLIVSFGAARLMASMLYGVRPTDPLAFTASAVIVLFVALAASWGPARRALKVDPLQALRCE